LTGNLNNNFVVTNVGATNGETDAIGRSTTGAGYRVDLEGFDNDLAAALAQTGGFPASNSAEYAVIYRGLLRNDRDRGLVLGQLATLRPGCKPGLETGVNSPIVRIPLRIRPGEVPSFGPEDVILHDGDAVLIPSGYHPNVSVPGHRICFLWAMAAHREVEDRQFGVVNVQPGFNQGPTGLEAGRANSRRDS